MSYVAVRGGERAILNAETLLQASRLAGGTDPVSLQQVEEQFGMAVDRVMGEGGLYARDLAAAAFKQAAGDTFEAAFLLRAHRSSLPRIGCSETVDTERMRVVRRISAAFKEIPGGQLLGGTSDYSHRLIRFELLEGEEDVRKAIRTSFTDLEKQGSPIPETFPKVVRKLREEGLLPGKEPSTSLPFDITLDSHPFPLPRSARLQTLARAETGGMLALAYAAMRGYGQVHPVIGELRVGDVPVHFKGPGEGNAHLLGWVRVTECEVITQMGKGQADGKPQFTLGYGLCFGHNETKAICMAVLDRTLMSPNPERPTEDQEFVLLHTDGVESSGFCLHYKLPHYVSFQAD
ncbi:MAG: carbon-phosphorus lyase complex subunit PhnI, partial [Syntrophobacteraceae bacterium]|nr:carbon-phosphorus lyase complex subunit PhnI [Syntrophobacteraceae bacterium]